MKSVLYNSSPLPPLPCQVPGECFRAVTVQTLSKLGWEFGEMQTIEASSRENLKERFSQDARALFKRCVLAEIKEMVIKDSVLAKRRGGATGSHDEAAERLKQAMGLH